MSAVSKPYHLRTHKKRIEAEDAARGLTDRQKANRSNQRKVLRHREAKERNKAATK